MKLLKRLMAGALSAAILVTSVATAGAVTADIIGDVDEDGKQTVADIIMIKQVVMGERMVKRVTERADINNDQKCSVDDIVMLKNYIMDEYRPAATPTAEIADGEIFFVENVHTERVMNAMTYHDRISQWTYTGSAAQQWRAVKKGDYYMLESVFNGQVWTMVNRWDNMWLSLQNIDDRDNPRDEQLFKFEIDENGQYLIRAKSSEDRIITVEFESSRDCEYLHHNSNLDSITAKWVLYNVKQAPIASDPTEILSEDFADTVFESFMDHFYLERSDNKEGYEIKGRNYFWDWAEMIEMVIDAYDNHPCDKYKQMVIECMDGFINEFGTNWAWNDFNDDIMWMVIACARTYNITKIDKYKETAKTNFDIVYSRGYTDSFGGGLLWRSNGDTSKNACINAPAVIAATYLYEIYNRTSYLDKAKDLFDWTTKTLVVDEGDRAGRVHDNINGDRPGGNDFTYNQGTYIGAATRLWEITGEQKYRDLAKRTAQYTVERKYGWDVIDNEGNIDNYCIMGENYNDGYGFKGIFMRWFGYYVEATGDTSYDEWLGKNLYYGWNNRNSKGLVCTRWDRKTAENWTGPFSYYNYVVLAQVAPYERLREIAGIQ